MKNPRIAVVLVGPQGDANIGAAARAMKNFGITDLRIVTGSAAEDSPRGTWGCSKDWRRA